MKKQRLTKEELRRIEYEFGEHKDLLPEEFSTVIEKAFDVIRPYIEIEQPMTEELSTALRQLIVEQYPLFRTVSGNWWAGWIEEIAALVALELAVNLTLLFEDFKNDVSRTGLYPDFEETVAFYTFPHEAHRRAMPNFEGTPHWDEIKEEIQQEIESDFEDEKLACELYNKLETEFIRAIQTIVFKYLGAQTETFDTEMWQHYGISLGSAFYRFNDCCSDLEYIIEWDELTEDPGIGFYEYNEQVKAAKMASWKEEVQKINQEN